MKTFRINKHLSLRLEGGVTKIYVNEEYFQMCKYLLMRLERIL